MKNRIYFLDNLRTFLIFLVILFHAGFTYQYALESNWIVIDPIKSDSIGLIGLYIDVFVMAVMFFISGYFIPVSLKNKTAWDYLKSKFKRIMLPWIVAVFTLIPAYKFIFLYSRGLPQEDWYSYFHLFQKAGADPGFFANDPTQHWLWFLPVLFLFQVLYLAMSKTNLLSYRISLKTGVILTFIIGLIYSEIIAISGFRGWSFSPILDFQRERLLIYFMFFLLGSLCYKLKVFETESRTSKYFIYSNVVLTIAMALYTVVAINLLMNMISPGREYFFISQRIDGIAYYSSLLLLMLSFLHILVHVFRRSFNRSGKVMAVLNNNSYNVYIIHLVVLGMVALPLVNLSMPAYLKFFILTILTFLISNIMVYAYNRFIQNNIYMKTSFFAISITVLFSSILFANKETPWSDNGMEVLQSNAVPQTTGIHEAVLKGDVEAVKQHIEAGSDLDEKDPSGGSSPLITAALFGKTEIARILIEAGADINFRNNEGSTALLLTAAFFCNTEIVEDLLTHGADKNIRNNAGSTALQSVEAPFEAVAGIYEYFGSALSPLGLELDMDQIENTRPVIAEMLR